MTNYSNFLQPACFKEAFPFGHGGCRLHVAFSARVWIFSDETDAHWNCMVTATKNLQPWHNTTVFLFIYFKWGVLQFATAPNWYPGKPKALFLIYRAFHGLEPNYLQKLLPPPHLLPWQLQSAEMLGLTSPDLLGYQGNSRGLSLSEFTPLLGSGSISRNGRGRIN